MCYSPPGPRCSHHSHQEMMKALTAVQSENEPNRKILLQERYEETKKVFYSTPRGQNELRRDIALLNTKIQSHPELASQLTDLKLYFQNGQILRKNQLAAYKVFVENRDSSIKEALNTSNKQTIASAVAFNNILSHIEADYIEAHITSPATITLATTNVEKNVLCLHQKYQTILETAKESDGKLVLAQTFNPSQASEIAAIFNTYQTSTALPRSVETTLQQWVQSWLDFKEITLIASIDTKTEIVQYLTPDQLFHHYSLGFKLKKKLGGTTPYRHGVTKELQDAIKDTAFSNAEIKHVISGKTKQTYLITTFVTNDLHHGDFYFAPQRSEEGELFYEVKSTHKSTQYNVILTLERNDRILSTEQSQPLKHALSTQFVRD